jgi:biopolymer transport protein ExbD
MRLSHTEQQASSIGINLTPLIDLVFILLIFFLVTTSFTKESGIDVNRPTAQTAVRQERGNLVIGVSRGGEIWIDNQQVDIRSVRAHVERLHAQNPEGTVIILADRESRTGLLVEVMDQVRLAGVTNVAIAATRPAAGS